MYDKAVAGISTTPNSKVLKNRSPAKVPALRDKAKYMRLTENLTKIKKANLVRNRNTKKGKEQENLSLWNNTNSYGVIRENNNACCPPSDRFFLECNITMSADEFVHRNNYVCHCNNYFLWISSTPYLGDIIDVCTYLNSSKSFVTRSNTENSNINMAK